MESLIATMTSIITFICGLIAKRVPWFNNNLIPIQNIMIGVVTAGIYYAFSKNISYATVCAGLFSGGLYDLFNNLRKIINNTEKNKGSEANG
jgi:hypothetical protein